MIFRPGYCGKDWPTTWRVIYSFCQVKLATTNLHVFKQGYLCKRPQYCVIIVNYTLIFKNYYFCPLKYLKLIDIPHLSQSVKK